MTGPPVLAGVVGCPVEHSLSPLIHTIWAARTGIDGYYISVAAPSTYDEFARIMDGLRKAGFVGVNITLPHKEHALRYAAAASDVAKRAGAANMLTFREDGPYADNSDVAGFAEAMKAASAAQGAQTALILGAGGSARAVALGLESLGVASVAVANRTKTKAQALAQEFGLTAVEWDERSAAVGMADIIVNTTSLGMSGQPSLELDLEGVRPGAVVADIVYSPLETPLLKAAATRDLKTVGGLLMLMHQAGPGFRAWFGGDCKVDERLHAELVAELKRRGRERGTG